VTEPHHPRVFADLDELAACVGEHLGYSGWHPVTQDQITMFADATGDDQWIHVDAARAASGPFGRTVAHGYLTLSLIPVLSREIYRMDGLKMGINYGSDKVRFPSPVLVDSRIRAGAQLLTFVPTDTGARVMVRFTIEIEGSDKPACVAEVLSMLVG
jgi:acyl dehydratase